MTATIVRFTTVHRAWIAIVACQASKSHAITCRTHIVRRAGVVVVANVTVGRKNAAKVGLAPIVGARISVVAGQCRHSPSAHPIRAGVTQRADIPVIAWLGVRFMHATIHQVAAVGRA